MSYQRGSNSNEYDPYYGGGGYYGRGGQLNDLSSFVMDHHVRMYWVAFFVLVAYWGFLWFLRHVFGDGHQNARNAVPTEEEAPAQPQANSGGYRRWIRRPGTSGAHVKREAIEKGQELY